MSATYIVTIGPVADNAEAVFEILNEVTDSQRQTADLLQSGGEAGEFDDKDEADDLADRLKAEGVDVEIERVDQRPEGFVVKGVVRTAPLDSDTPLGDIDGVGPNRATELREIGYETVADVIDASRMVLTRDHDVGDALAQRLLDAARGRKIQGVTVRAFDRDLRSEQLLGEATTDEEGRYEITYTANQFRRAEQDSSDLVLRVFNAMGEELEAEADRGAVPETDTDERNRKVLFDATPLETVDLTVDLSSRLEPSEYERVEAELAPLLENVAPADLTDEDIWFLVSESSIERALIEAFASSAAIARETGLPSEPVYGLVRSGLPAELEDLLEVRPETLRAGLEDAIDENVVREGVIHSFDDLVDRFEELRAAGRPRVHHEVVGNVIREGTREPLTEYGVSAIDVTTDLERVLAEGFTDADGRVEFGFTLPEQTDQDRQVRFVIRDRRGVERQVVKKTIELNREEVVSVDIEVPEPAPPGAIALQDATLRDALRRSTVDDNRVETLLSTLGEREEPLTSLADIREAGGLARLLERTENPPVSPDDPAVDLLDAHVYLSLLTPDPSVNATLIERDYTTPFAIANAPRREFVDSLSGEDSDLTEVEAARMHYSARAQKYAMDNILTTLLTNRANGIATDFEGVE